MGLGIIEPTRASDSMGEFVPGTSALFDEAAHGSSVKQHARGKEASLILVPQPSSSPNDPLNWPTWKKELCFFALMYNVMMGAILSPILSTIGGPVVEEFRISFPQFALLSGWPLLSTGLTALVCNAIGQVYGKRPLYLIGTSLLLATTIWNSRVTSYSSFVACRVVEGVGNGPYESIVLSSIGDLFFVHQRGVRVMVYNFATLGTVFFSPIIGGYISQTHGWQVQFYIVAGFLFIGLLLLVFYVPEHTYERVHHPVVQESTDVESAGGDEKKENVRVSSPGEGQQASTEAPKTYLQELMPVGGRISRTNPLIALCKPVLCMFYPTVFWGFMIGGVWSAFNAAIVITMAQTYAASLTPAYLGYVNVFPFLGTLASSAIGSVLADRITKWAARRNGGVFEPEFRMFLVLPGLIFGIPGYIGYGNYASSSRDPNWVIVSLIFGVFAFGNQMTTACGYNYVLDAHNDARMDVTISMILMRNLFWWGASQFMSDWLEITSTAHVYDISGAIMAGTTLLTVVFYIYGKVFRSKIQQLSPLPSWGWD